MNGGGFFGGLIVQQIKEVQERRKVKKETALLCNQLLEITSAYVVYISDKPEDQNPDTQKILQATVELISKF